MYEWASNREMATIKTLGKTSSTPNEYTFFSVAVDMEICAQASALSIFTYPLRRKAKSNTHAHNSYETIL